MVSSRYPRSLNEGRGLAALHAARNFVLSTTLAPRSGGVSRPHPEHSQRVWSPTFTR